MIVHSIRRITNDARHNAFTGCCWFKGNLYVSYRQGDAHVCHHGRVVILRSRDRGASWDHVAVLRGPADSRDSHLYTDGERLYAVGFCALKKNGALRARSGGAWSADGDRWTTWTPYEGTADNILWRPQFFAGKHYCAGYDYSPGQSAVFWFESGDGRRWKKARRLHSGPEQPNECYLEILSSGKATMLMRCEGGPRHPYLCASQYPFRKWRMQKLANISIAGPCLWTVDDDVYIGGRWWSVKKDWGVAHTAIFKVVKGKAELECVLPSGPGWDHSYMAAARHPDNARRFAISFYSDAVAPNDPTVNQWTHPDIYLADVTCDAACLRDGFLVSKRIAPPANLEAASCPEPNDRSLAFRKARAGTIRAPDFLDISHVINRQPGLVYIVRDIKITGVPSGGTVRLHLGYDGPVKVWWNGAQAFAGPGANPAIKDQTVLNVTASRRGGSVNRLVIALDTNGGKAQGVFVRWENSDAAWERITNAPRPRPKLNAFVKEALDEGK